MGMTDLMSFGERNLAPMREVVNRQAGLTSRLSQINASGWLQETMAASCKIPSFFDRLTAKKPEFYKTTLERIRPELVKMVASLESDIELIKPDIDDLTHDIAALQAVAADMTDVVLSDVAAKRLRTLLGGQQNVVMLLQSMTNAITQSAGQISQIDDLLTNTIPAWTMAFNS
jgi:hypothetical protein